MPRETVGKPTLVGHVVSVRGGVVQVRLLDIPTTLVMVEGSAHRIGQIGAFVRIPLGFTHLYGVCTQVGADSLPGDTETEIGALEVEPFDHATGFRWMTISLFGESVEGRFDRGVGQYPTVGDEVHLVTAQDLNVIYSRSGKREDGLPIGRIADTEGISAELKLSALVNRHACVVGSTGAGKSNLVAVVLRALAGPTYKSARVLVVDPHGEYGSALPQDRAHSIQAGSGSGSVRQSV